MRELLLSLLRDNYQRICSDTVFVLRGILKSYVGEINERSLRTRTSCQLSVIYQRASYYCTYYYTPNDVVDILLILGKCHGNYRHALCLYAERCPNRRVDIRMFSR